MIKKITTLFAFLCILFTTQASFAELDFPDVRENHWAYNNVKILKNLGIVVGYPDGNFRPDRFVSRAEFCSMAVKALKLLGQPYTPTHYKDLPTTHWGYNNIQIASHFGIVSGYTDAYFRPNDDVKRIEVISVIMSALNLSELTNQEAIKLLDEYRDANFTPEWALVKTAQAKKLDMIVIMPGREGYIEPMRPATRGELAVFLTKMIDAFALSPSERIAKTSPQPEPEPPAKPKTRRLYDGIIIENAYIDGDYAILPAGTILPMAVMACTQSEKTKTGYDFRARATKNFITKDKRMIIPVGSQLYGIFQDVRKPKYFITNSRIILASSTLKMNRIGEETSIPFSSVATAEAKYNGKTLWDKVSFYVIRGKSTPLHKSSIENFVLLEPVRIQIRDEWVTF